MFPQVVQRHLAYSLSNISAKKNYQNRLMCVEVIVCYICVVFLTQCTPCLKKRQWFSTCMPNWPNGKYASDWLWLSLTGDRWVCCLVMSLCDARNRTTSPFSFLMGTMSNKHQNRVPASHHHHSHITQPTLLTSQLHRHIWWWNYKLPAVLCQSHGWPNFTTVFVASPLHRHLKIQLV